MLCVPILSSLTRFLHWDFKSEFSPEFRLFDSDTMKPPGLLVAKTSGLVFIRRNRRLISYKLGRVYKYGSWGVGFPVSMTSSSSSSRRPEVPLTHSPLHGVVGSDHVTPHVFHHSPTKLQTFEEDLEKAIYGCRFLTFLGILGSLVGSLLCYIKGCTYVWESFINYSVNHAKVIPTLIEAFDIYLIGTVMLVFGVGLYELFVCNLDIAKSLSAETASYGSNLFGLFPLKERPQWLEIKSVNELKTKLGHVIVMVLLVGLFEKSVKVVISSALDLLCFSASILLSSGCLYLLSKLNNSKRK